MRTVIAAHVLPEGLLLESLSIKTDRVSISMSSGAVLLPALLSPLVAGA